MVTPQMQQTAHRIAPHFAPQTSTARIVVVERDAVLRKMFARALLAGGHDVVKVGNPISLLWYLREVAARLPGRAADVVVFGIASSRPDDMHALRTLEEKHDHLPLVILARNDSVAAGLAASHIRTATVLTEPFTMSALQTAVASIIPVG